MNGVSANCPQWLIDRIANSGGNISFYQYMDWSLNDADYGAYSTGRLQIGPKGDFATSPSLGSDFAELVALQVVDWLQQLQRKNVDKYPLSLIEFGPGEGDFAFSLIRSITQTNPELIDNLELIMVEKNKAMIERQKECLRNIKNISIRWLTFEELISKPAVGIIIAHEVLDAFPVERIVFRDQQLFRQGVKLEYQGTEPFLTFSEMPLCDGLNDSLLDINNSLGIRIPPAGVKEGWCSEYHKDLEPWLKKVSKALIYGSLLIIDYCLEASRYYSCSRQSGTLISYRNQSASNQVLKYPGYCDITSHLCLETLIFFARKSNWHFLGHVRQGQALLALGLAERLNSLRNLANNQLDIALKRRETLLRLVDPQCLGEFRWLAFELNNESTINISNLPIGLKSKFLSTSPEYD